jgi:Domain of unknown function (DUF4402)
LRGASLCALLVAGLATPALAAGTSAAGKAITLAPLSILNLSNLDFATNIAGATAGTVVINPTNDVRTVTGGVVAAGGVPQAARFISYGTGLQILQVTRGPLPVLTRVGPGPAATMSVTQLTLNGPVTRVLTAAGLLDLRVGGTLAVAANQPDGVYSGTFQITVTYQ